MTDESYAGDISPKEAWEKLKDDPNAVLVDVRTKPEWGFVGVPDLSKLGKQVVLAEWQAYPEMQVNESFLQQMEEAGVSRDKTVMFLCRSGARSKSAAIAATAQGYKAAFNIAGGFEGDKDEQNHRGNKNGWKHAGLPWVQQ